MNYYYMLQPKCAAGGGDGGDACVGQRSSGQEDSKKHRWPLQMSCDLRPREVGVPWGGVGCVAKQGLGKGIWDGYWGSVCVCVDASYCKTTRFAWRDSAGKGRKQACASALAAPLSWQWLRKSRSRFYCVWLCFVRARRFGLQEGASGIDSEGSPSARGCEVHINTTHATVY